MNYVTKRIKVQAIQFTGLNRNECTEFCFDSKTSYTRVRVNRHLEMLITTVYGNIRIKEHDWILRYEDGSLAGCDNEIFKFYFEPENERYEIPKWFRKEDLYMIENLNYKDYKKMMNDIKGENDERVSD